MAGRALTRAAPRMPSSASRYSADDVADLLRPPQVRPAGGDGAPNQEELLQAEIAAQEAGVGMWTKDPGAAANSVRKARCRSAPPLSPRTPQ